MKKKWYFIIGGGVAILVILGVVFSGKIANTVTHIDSYYAKVFHQSINKGISASFKKTADKFNQRGPVMVSKYLRWDKTVAGPGARIAYIYTLTNLSSKQIDQARLNSNLRQRLGSAICKNEKMRPSIELGATYVYVYRGNDGVEVGRIAINNQSCGAIQPGQ